MPPQSTTTLRISDDPFTTLLLRYQIARNSMLRLGLTYHKCAACKRKMLKIAQFDMAQPRGYFSYN